MKRGQAALEFLATYGWAILIVLVMIGALSYFGITNPTRYLPDKCVFTTGINCVDYVVRDSSGILTLQFNIKNGLGESIRINGATVSFNNIPSSCSAPTLPATVQPDANQSFTCTDNGWTSPGLGQPAKFSLNLTYQLAQGSYNRVINGEISTKVQ